MEWEGMGVAGFLSASSPASINHGQYFNTTVYSTVRVYKYIQSTYNLALMS